MTAYSPFDLALGGCQDAAHARLMAHRLLSQPGLDTSAHHLALAEKYLPVLLFAAAVMDEDYRRISHWMAYIHMRKMQAEIDSVLRWKKDHRAKDAFNQFTALPADARSAIVCTIEVALQSALRCGRALGGSDCLIYAGHYVPKAADIATSEVLDQAITAYCHLPDAAGQMLTRQNAQVAFYGDGPIDPAIMRAVNTRLPGQGKAGYIKDMTVAGDGPLLVIMRSRRRQCLADVRGLLEQRDCPIMLVDLTRRNAWDIEATHVLSRGHKGTAFCVLESSCPGALDWQVKKIWPSFMARVKQAAAPAVQTVTAGGQPPSVSASTESAAPGAQEVSQEQGSAKPIDLDEHLAALNALVGLDQVREQMRAYAALAHIQQKRSNHQPQSMHLALLGNPGTGKTTVARVIGKILHAQGMLPTDKFIEAQRSDLVGQYIGHTEAKTKQMIEKAIGGVLFIDEAYALDAGSGNDFGHEAIAELVAAMENHRHDLVVIFAGYEDRTRRMLELNPGMQSRIQHTWSFRDYTDAELSLIAQGMSAERGYTMTDAAQSQMNTVLSQAKSHSKTHFGNAREVRSQLERAIMRHAYRIVQDKLTETDALDIIDACDIVYEPAGKSRQPLGFAA